MAPLRSCIAGVAVSSFFISFEGGHASRHDVYGDLKQRRFLGSQTKPHDDDTLPDDPVMTSNGLVIGEQDTFRGCDRWLGIPFSEPPVGKYRFGKPGPPKTRFAETGYIAKTYSEHCVYKDGTGNEDCLYLNVWRPEGVSPNAKLPVMVWFHGGAFVTGTASTGRYDGCALAADQQVVVVTTNYRLGAFGFTAFSDDWVTASSNFGLHDQRQAIHWVHKEIRAFGGDKEKITLFGQSAGAISVWHHMASPASAGLFRGAISESGFPAARAAYDAVSFTAALGASVGCIDPRGTELKRCMKKLTVEQVATATIAGDPQNLGMYFPWMPVIDGVEISQHPMVMLRKDNFSNNVPVLVGHNTDEGVVFVDLVFNKGLGLGGYIEIMAKTLGTNYLNSEMDLNPEEIKEIIMAYPPNLFGDSRGQASAAFGDMMFTCSSLLSAAAHSLIAPTYAFRFNFRAKACHSTVEEFLLPGVLHSAEIPFIFQEANGCALELEQVALSRRMQDTWGSFARDLVPEKDDGKPLPRFNGSDQVEVVFDTNDSLEKGYKADKCAMWKHLFYDKIREKPGVFPPQTIFGGVRSETGS